MAGRAVWAGVAGLGLLWGGVAHAAEGLVVWMEPTVPGEKALARAENVAGSTAHLAHVDLAFPPQPVGPEDEQDYLALREAVAAARARWDEFEVEYGIAVDLEAALDRIDIVRDPRDADSLITALALQGSAVHRAFDPQDFQEGARAKAFRLQYPGTAHLNEPWVDALAIDPDHTLGQDVADAATYAELQQLQDQVKQLRDGALSLAGLPTGTALVVDGSPAGTAGDQLPLRPGTHYVHVVRNGVAGGRARIEVVPGELVPMPLLVDTDELAQARAKIAEGTTTGFPEDVKTALDRLAGHHGGPIFVGAVDDGKVTILPYARGAELLKQRVVTVVAVGDIGPEVVVSPIFDEAEGSYVTAPGASGSLGLEVGIYNGVILGGLDLAFTPANTVTFGNKELTDNISTSALPQPWGGIGVYALRPVGTSPYLLLAGTYGFNGPAHMAFGGRATLGIPSNAEGSWIRVTMGGSTSPDVMKDWKTVRPEATPMHVMFLRVGLATLF